MVVQPHLQNPVDGPDHKLFIGLNQQEQYLCQVILRQLFRILFDIGY